MDLVQAQRKVVLKTVPVHQYRVRTGKIVLNSRTFQRLLKDFPTVFKD